MARTNIIAIITIILFIYLRRVRLNIILRFVL